MLGVQVLALEDVGAQISSLPPKESFVLILLSRADLIRFNLLCNLYSEKRQHVQVYWVIGAEGTANDDSLANFC